MTQLALRHTFAGVSEEHTKRMIGETAIEVYDLDDAALHAIAREIAAPTLEELAEPILAVPEAGSVTAFRSGKGGWS